MTQSFFQTFILLLLVTDPFGNVPLFVTALKDVAPERRPRIVLRECAIAFLLLLMFMFFGRHFLAALQLTDISLRIGGSVILLIIAIRMIFPHPDGVLGRSESGCRKPSAPRS
jgi:small neutral amino acid transporter SnatA (MarC family)